MPWRPTASRLCNHWDEAQQAAWCRPMPGMARAAEVQMYNGHAQELSCPLATISITIITIFFIKRHQSSSIITAVCLGKLRFWDCYVHIVNTYQEMFLPLIYVIILNLSHDFANINVYLHGYLYIYTSFVLALTHNSHLQVSWHPNACFNASKPCTKQWMWYVTWWDNTSCSNLYRL